MIDPSELRVGLIRDLGPAPSFAHRCLVDAACIAAAQMAQSNDPAWHRAFCDALERLHGVVPIAVIPDDDPWKLVLGRVFDGLTGKIANVDVWYLLGLDPYERSTPEQRRLTEVMRVLGWRRKIIRHNAQRVGRGFRRGLDTRTIFVFRCPVTQEIYYIGHDPVPAVVEAYQSAFALVLMERRLTGWAHAEAERRGEIELVEMEAPAPGYDADDAL